ncbi:MAG: group II intron reverse transcriptase/maturase [Verrucomicrobiota bacterium]
MADESQILTPVKLRNLQRTLYRKAKNSPKWKAWSLYSELFRRDVIEEAMRRVSRNRGSYGVDGYTLSQMHENWDGFLGQLQRELKEKTYRPQAVRRVWIDKADGGKRPLGIPTVKDRVVQTALVILIEPIFEADFHSESYAYRPRRRQQHAVQSIVDGILGGLNHVLDADLSGYFDTIDHRRLMKLVSKRVSDGSILKLIKRILRTPVVETICGRRQRIEANTGKGVPQGGVISPLLSNLFLNKLDHAVNNLRISAKLVRYADDFVILTTRRNRPELRCRVADWIGKVGLTLNERKTSEINVDRESMEFLGFRIAKRTSWKSGKRYVHVEPSMKSRKRFHESIREELNHWTTWRDADEVTMRVNRIIRGWSQYFHFGNSSKVFACERFWLEERLRTWLIKKHRGRSGRKGRYTTYPTDRLYGEYQLYQLPLTVNR